MRLLFLTNFYPPASRGGYEQWCQEVADRLRQQGHQILILTSRQSSEQRVETEPDWIYRDLFLEMEFASLRNSIQFFTSRKTREAKNLARLDQLIREFKPDIMMVWGMWNLHRSLPALAEALLPGRVVYYMGDYWPTLPSQYEFYWQAPSQHWIRSVPKQVLGFVARRLLAQEELPTLKFEHVLFPTEFMRDELNHKGISFGRTRVIYGAIDTNLYPFRNGSLNGQAPSKPLSFLYVGRLTTEKGVHTAIKAVGRLVHHHQIKHLRLTIAGDGTPDYSDYLHNLARQEKVDKFITFLGAQSKEAIPKLYAQSDVLLFTSIWQEPFGRVLIEAMASGCVVVGTATGGAAEILKHEENALVFSPDDASGLAAQIMHLIESPHLRQQLVKAGRQTALSRFDIERMTTEIETYLQTIVSAR